MRFRQRIIKRVFYQVNHSNRKNTLCVLTLLNLSSFQTDSDQKIFQFSRKYSITKTHQLKLRYHAVTYCELQWDVRKSALKELKMKLGLCCFSAKNKKLEIENYPGGTYPAVTIERVQRWDFVRSSFIGWFQTLFLWILKSLD